MALILGIESSCDETAAAIVRDGREVLSNVVATQHGLHERYSGVVPEIASRAHLERILPVIMESLVEADTSLDQLDAIAVGHEPGLIGSLLVGLGAAKALAWSTGLPLIGVNHVWAHLWSPCLERSPIDFPAIGIVASGGHTAIYLLQSATVMTPIGSTIDDAIGEAFDKAATILEAGYPGGPAIEQLAAKGDAMAMTLPVARLENELDFSFSGLKTALLYGVRGRPKGRGRQVTYPRSINELTVSDRADAAASFQHAAIRAVDQNLRRALEMHQVKSLLAGGGVTANIALRDAMENLSRERGIELRLALPAYCVDNAAMIAGLADALHEQGVHHGMDLPAAARVTH